VTTPLCVAEEATCRCRCRCSCSTSRLAVALCLYVPYIARLFVLLLPPTDLGFLLLPQAQAQALAAAGSQQPRTRREGGRQPARARASGGFSSVQSRQELKGAIFSFFTSAYNFLQFGGGIPRSLCFSSVLAPFPSSRFGKFSLLFTFHRSLLWESSVGVCQGIQTSDSEKPTNVQFCCDFRSPPAASLAVTCLVPEIFREMLISLLFDKYYSIMD
jgi:hypothetical protein